MNSLSEKKIYKIKNIYQISKIQTEARKYDQILNNTAKLSYNKSTLKTKLGNNFPTESFEDRSLLLSIMLRTCDSFKVVRDGRNVFYKWMDNMFEEFFLQGDMER